MKSKAQKQEELDERAQAFGKERGARFYGLHEDHRGEHPKIPSRPQGVERRFSCHQETAARHPPKEKGIDVDLKQFKTSVGTIFSRDDIEKIAGPAFTFFSKA